MAHRPMNYPCKLGTMPAVVHAIDRRTPLEVGRVIKIKRQEGGKWETVKVTEVWPCGYFMADLW